MTGGSLGIRSGSYGSLDKQLQNNSINGVLAIQSARKPSKMLKEKDRLFHWICKFAGRKKVGMLLLCLISAAVFVWVLYVGKGEDGQDVVNVGNISVNNSITLSFSESSRQHGAQSINMTFPLALPPPPPAVFLGYTLPPGHPCNTFTLPPPPADKKRTGPRPCPVCYLPVEEAIALMPKVPSYSPVLKNLTYIYEENLSRDTEFGGSDFGGYPTLKQRSDSYDIRESMSVHCGFVRGSKPGRNTGYDMDEVDLNDMEQCNGVVVASAIFGNFDEINQPRNISDYSKETVCFYMFIDNVTEAYLRTSGKMGSDRKVGIWRTVVVHNPPYTDGRRTGKIPKLLVHRMFPNARFSLWIDGKLELVVDPYQILESMDEISRNTTRYLSLLTFILGSCPFMYSFRLDTKHQIEKQIVASPKFLWRKNVTFAISRHYKRFDVFTEAEANKAAGKYDNASIDFQVEFYKKEGLTPYSQEKLPITSDVPEGCVIIREHVPISNLAACLWFHEVDRFTSRDQISFSIVRDHIRARTNWTISMFLDCERRNFVVQKYHRDVLEHMAPPLPKAVPPPPLLPPPPPPPPPPPSPPALSNEPQVKPSTETSPERVVNAPAKRPPRRGRDRRPGSTRHRKIVAGGRHIDSS